MTASSALLRTAPSNRSATTGEALTALRISSADVLPHSTTRTKASNRWATAFTSTTGRIGGKATRASTYLLLAAPNRSLIAGEPRSSALLEGFIRVEDGRKSNLNL